MTQQQSKTRWMYPAPDVVAYNRVSATQDAAGVIVTGSKGGDITAQILLDWPTVRSLASWLMCRATENEPRRPEPADWRGCAQSDTDGLHETACPDCDAAVVECCAHCEPAPAGDWERAR
jgi:hypothetical protein